MYNKKRKEILLLLSKKLKALKELQREINKLYAELETFDRKIGSVLNEKRI